MDWFYFMRATWEKQWPTSHHWKSSYLPSYKGNSSNNSKLPMTLDKYSLVQRGNAPISFQVGAVPIGSILLQGQSAAHPRSRQGFTCSSFLQPRDWTRLCSLCQPAERVRMERQQMTTYPLARMMQTTKNGFCERWLQRLWKAGFEISRCSRGRYSKHHTTG